MEIITPSYAPDLELCRDLNRSILASTPDDVSHRILVSRRDLGRFAPLAGVRTEIVCTAEVLPRALVEVGWLNYSVNLRRPFPPVRGWMRQQLVKLTAAAASTADVVVVVDSDIEFIRPFHAATFMREGVVRLYRWPNQIHAGMPRHIQWHGVSRDLLGIRRTPLPYHDYISSPLAWDPAIVRQLLARIEQVAGRPWPTVLGALLHFSEATLYGVFVDECLGAPANTNVGDDPWMHGYWLTTPITEAGLAELISGVSPSDVAVMISAKSRTPLPERRAAIASLREALRANGPTVSIE